MELGLQGRVAVVTAASKGLGRSSALALSQEGCRVVLNSRDPEALEKAAGDMPGEVATVVGDMSDPSTPQRVVDAAVERFGALHVVVANNGGPPPGGALDVSDDAVRAAVEANLLASVRLVRAALPHLRSAGWGRICMITSSTIKQPAPFLSLSNVARTGLWAWAKTAARELFPDGITLNLACPGAHATDRMKALGGAAGSGPSDDRGARSAQRAQVMGDPDDFGKIVAFLCSDAAKFTTGTAVMVDGGASSGLL